MRVRTLEAPQHHDDYSFRGLGRWKSKAAIYTTPAGSATPVVTSDRAQPEADVPVGPGEPRG